MVLGSDVVWTISLLRAFNDDDDDQIIHIERYLNLLNENERKQV